MTVPYRVAVIFIRIDANLLMEVRGMNYSSCPLIILSTA